MGFQRISGTIAVIGLAALLIGCGGAPRPSQDSPVPGVSDTPSSLPTESTRAARLRLATTTSTADSGLLDWILPDFEALCSCRVEVIAVGTGQALELGRRGDADVLLVHDPAAEEEFMAAGHGVRREPVMFNDFVLVGPASDPAGVRGVTQVVEAFRRIAQAQAAFVSRGDGSGTHRKEQAIWQAAGLRPTGDWYLSAGQGMGEVLSLAEELQAYTLSDRGTYLARTLPGIRLEVLAEGDPLLRNPYHVIAVNPAKSPRIPGELANRLVDWLISLPTQERIGQFGVPEFGTPLFTPDSGAWRAAHPSTPQF